MRRLRFFWPLAAVAFVAAAGFVTMYLYNYVVPFLAPSAPLTDFWHALGLLALVRLLTGGFGRRGGWHRRGQRGWARKWDNLPPDKQAALRERWRACRAGGRPGQDAVRDAATA